MEDYIFVEGKRYISAKKASEVTGYTSDYIGQMAREGRVKSKKVGRIRFVEEDGLSLYTSVSDRKKNTYITLNSEEDSQEEVQQETVNIIKEADEDTVEILEPRKIRDDYVRLEDKIDFEKAYHHIVKAVKKIDFDESKKKAVAVAVTLAVIFTPYMFGTKITSSIGDDLALAYNATKFDLEDLSMEVYEKIKKDGPILLMTDSLAYSENKIRTSLTQYIYDYSEFIDSISDSSRRIASRKINIKIEKPEQKLKAFALGSIESIARGVYEFINAE